MTTMALPSLMAEAELPATGRLQPPLRRSRTNERFEENDFTAFTKYPSDGEDPYLCLYRGQTVAILRRFLRASMETGRLPSVLGREFFRAKMSWWRPATFEDAVIFVHDVERSLEKLERREQELIAKIVLQEHTQLETARLLHSTLRTVARNYAEALDHLSEIFLAGEILTPFAVAAKGKENSCQEAKDDEFRASCCSEGENIF
jgi:DNA-directed RNA polymerase specialized sigma24 family protein